ncbi:MAG TPA: DsbA family oxidoreductase [Sphingobacteriaceae bacterium]
MNTENKMTIEIWSDVMCPFCYLGKKKFETALSQFSGRDNIEVTWKSFQLMPSLRTDPEMAIHDFLSRERGLPAEQMKQLNSQVAAAGREIGLEFNFEKAIVANTYLAHRFLHFTKEHGKQNEAEELLFQAFFRDGKNVDDVNTLAGLGGKLGFDQTAVLDALTHDRYSEDVNRDINEAQQLGIRGVPFFVLDRKYAVSGAQDPSVFLQTIDQAYTEWENEKSLSAMN